jgi:hypothetical protein
MPNPETDSLPLQPPADSPDHGLKAYEVETARDVEKTDTDGEQAPRDTPLGVDAIHPVLTDEAFTARFGHPTQDMDRPDPEVVSGQGDLDAPSPDRSPLQRLIAWILDLLRS